MSDKIKWSTNIFELPDDISFEGVKSRLNKPQKYDDERLFAYDCRKIAEYALLDVRYTNDVLEMFDTLLDKKVPEKVQSSISYSLGEMVYCNPQIKDDVIVISDMNDVIHNRNEEKVKEKLNKLKDTKGLDAEEVVEKPKKDMNVNSNIVKSFLDKEH